MMHAHAAPPAAKMTHISLKMVRAPNVRVDPQRASMDIIASLVPRVTSLSRPQSSLMAAPCADPTLTRALRAVIQSASRVLRTNLLIKLTEVFFASIVTRLESVFYGSMLRHGRS